MKKIKLLNNSVGRLRSEHQVKAGRSSRTVWSDGPYHSAESTAIDPEHNGGSRGPLPGGGGAGAPSTRVSPRILASRGGRSGSPPSAQGVVAAAGAGERRKGRRRKQKYNKLSGIGGWPSQERPREKLSKQGSEALGDAELLAILLRTGRAGRSAVEVGRDLIKLGGWRGLDRMGFNDLKSQSGMGLAKAAQVKAALEVGKRLIREERTPEEMQIMKSRDLVEVLLPRFRDEKKETFLVVLLDAKHHVINQRKISVGSLTASLVHPREVMKAVVEESAAAFIAVHNHPSGDVTPSPDDRDITMRLAAVAELMGVKFLDHLILGDGKKKYFSFFEKGLLSER